MTEAASAVGSAATEDSAGAAQAASAEPTKSCCGGDGGHDDHGLHQPLAGDSSEVRDPVCGMTVDPATSKHRFGHQGKTLHFCSAGCRGKFAADPAKYLGNKLPQAEMPVGTIYTCPMHPQIRQVGPGSCPICG
jgi:Cu+-exporting ATPase